MSFLNQFLGASGCPVGGYIPVQPNYRPNALVSANGKEYLRPGIVVPYEAKYANSIGEAPWLGVRMQTAYSFGSGATPYYDIAENADGSIIVLASTTANTIYSATSWTASTARTISGSGHVPRAVRFYAPSGIFVALTTTGGNIQIVTSSTDAATWTMRFSMTTTSLFSSTYTGRDFTLAFASSLNLWMGMHSNSIASGVSFTRGDGADPTTATWASEGAGALAAIPNTVTGICASPSIFVLWGESTPGDVYTSTTGLSGSWTLRTTGLANQAQKVVWTGSKFIAFSAAAAVESTDGITWTPLASLPGVYGQGLFADGSGFVLAHDGSGSALLERTMVSTDHGASWTPISIAPFFSPTANRFSGRNFLPNNATTNTGYRIPVSALLPSAAPTHVGQRDSLAINSSADYIPLLRIL